MGIEQWHASVENGMARWVQALLVKPVVIEVVAFDGAVTVTVRSLVRRRRIGAGVVIRQRRFLDLIIASHWELREVLEVAWDHVEARRARAKNLDLCTSREASNANKENADG